MPECIFCNIVSGSIPCEKVYEDDRTLAFLDIHPVNSGHTLLISKDHYPKMVDVPDDFLGEIYIRAKMLMKKIQKALNADFVVLSVVGVDVDHFHIHLIPRYYHDGLANFWPQKEYAEGEIQKIAQKIRSVDG